MTQRENIEHRASRLAEKYRESNPDKLKELITILMNHISHNTFYMLEQALLKLEKG